MRLLFLSKTYVKNAVIKPPDKATKISFPGLAINLSVKAMIRHDKDSSINNKNARTAIFFSINDIQSRNLLKLFIANHPYLISTKIVSHMV
jgi:hypothetical protein